MFAELEKGGRLKGGKNESIRKQKFTSSPEDLEDLDEKTQKFAMDQEDDISDSEGEEEREPEVKKYFLKINFSFLKF